MKEQTTYGTYLDWLRENRSDKQLPSNPYIYKAAEMKELIFTTREIRDLNGKIFCDNRKTIVEIGCYKGDTLKELSENNQNSNFIGIDIKYKRVVKTSMKIAEHNLKNAVTVIADAKDFFESVKDKSIHGVAVFYPDPWTKDSQKKKRLLNIEFLQLINQKLVTDGFIWFKTDNYDYFSEVKDFMQKAGFKTSSPGASLPKLPDHETFFEKMFREKGVSKKELIVYS